MPNDSDTKLIDFLIRERFLTEEQVKALQAEALQVKQSFEIVLLTKGLMKDRDLGKVIADVHDWPFVHLKGEAIDPKVLALIPEEVARTERVIAFGQSRQGIKVATSNPDNPVFKSQKEVTLIPYYATPKDIADGLYRYQKEIGPEFAKLIESHFQKASSGKTQDSAVVKIVDLLLTHGYQNKASDIHIDPQSDDTVVRFRVDGILHDVVTIPRALHDLVVTRIKILSRLRTDEHQAPQDGKIAFVVEGDRADIRVSIVPTTKGENVVMRLLSQSSQQFTLDDLGLSDADFVTLQSAIRTPWGMILVTGPTGSGKTTTLYGVLKILNRREVNIATIEDPVEYAIDGITQIQVNPKANLTFASGLRSLVRQDPNIIMVGEIRDEETASIAVNAAMTGHLVLSTLHTNDAPTALPRLLDMGIEPFLVASTVNVIIAQRLMRKICPRCIQSHEMDHATIKASLPEAAFRAMIQGKKKAMVYKGKGCRLCQQTGYLGRVGVFELLMVTDEIRALIIQNADTDTIRKLACRQGMRTMTQDAIEKVLNGVTTIDELIRVVKA